MVSVETWATAPALMLLALLLEVVIGWPRWLYRVVKHPVVWIGALISFLEAHLNDQTSPDTARQAGGVVTAIAVTGTAALAAFAVAEASKATHFGIVMQVAVASSLLAARSLYTHVADVADPLVSGNLEAARQAVGQIVGRSTEGLDEAGVCRAGIESLAENTSDGVIAPLFWGVLLGLPGLAAYKAINTLDSMIGHKSERFLAFGRCSARLDDFANFVPARLTGMLFVLVQPSRKAFAIMLRDAGKHRSPNAGWPEAAMAGALDRRLSGPRRYDQTTIPEPWLNGDAPDPHPADLRHALWIYSKALSVAATLLLLWILLS